MMYRYGCPFTGGFGFEWIFMLIFWALIIWAVFALIRNFSGKSSSDWHIGDREDEAMKILKERYAKGEIDKEEFEQKKEALLKK